MYDPKSSLNQKSLGIMRDQPRYKSQKISDVDTKEQVVTLKKEVVTLNVAFAPYRRKLSWVTRYHP